MPGACSSRRSSVAAMPVRIRLARQGRKRQPVYRIRVQVRGQLCKSHLRLCRAATCALTRAAWVAGAQDSKAKRDGKFIEETGAYYPVAESELERKEKLKVLRLEHVRGHS